MPILIFFAWARCTIFHTFFNNTWHDICPRTCDMNHTPSGEIKQKPSACAGCLRLRISGSMKFIAVATAWDLIRGSLELNGEV